MLSNLRLSPLLLIVAVVVAVADGGKVRVKCEDEIGHDEKWRSNRTCLVTNLQRTPWNDGERVAPYPEWVDASFYTATVNHSRIFMLNLTWKQQASKFFSYVKGYYMEIRPVSLVGSGMKKKFLFTASQLDDLKRKVKNRKKKMLYFNYDGFGSSAGEHVASKEHYTITLHALPMYSNTQENLGRVKWAESPDCANVPDLDTKPMIACPKETRGYDDYYDYYPSYAYYYNESPVDHISDTKPVFDNPKVAGRPGTEQPRKQQTLAASDHRVVVVNDGQP